MKPSPLRWRMISLAFVATVINYLDRQTLSVAAPVLQEKFHISDEAYSWVVSAFLGTYTIMNGASGPLIDRLGTKIGYALCVAWWSAAAAMHALAAGVFNSGSAAGAILAPPLVAYLIATWGWQAAFLFIGLTGGVWLIAWWALYYTPKVKPGAAVERPVPVMTLITTRMVIAFTISKIFLDPVWYFYIFWFPKYLKTTRNFDLPHIGKYAWIPFMVAGFGNLFGG